VNILDEDIDAAQCQQLRRWKIHFQRIGIHVGRFGMKDRNELVPLLHRLSRPTFFPEITVSTILSSFTQPIALSFLMSFPTNARAIYAEFCGTERFERGRNALVK